MRITAKEISQYIQGSIEGDPETVVTGFSKIEEGKPGDICFLANLKYTSYAYTTSASVLLVSNTFKPVSPVAPVLIRVADVYSAISQLLEKFGVPEEKPIAVIDPLAYIHPEAKIGEGVTIGAFAWVGAGSVIEAGTVIHPQVYIDEEVVIGENGLLYPGVRVLKGCKVGARAIIHANAVIGSDGFGFAPQEDGRFKKVPQVGNVVIGDDVEIGANACIDRATMGSTTIGNGVKIDNLVQIAHNVVIGDHSAIAAQAGIAGSAKVGKHCLIGGQAGLVGHIKVADRVKIQAQSGINKSIEKEDTAYYGSPALPYQDYLRSYVWFRNLPELATRLDKAEQEIAKWHEGVPEGTREGEEKRISGKIK